MPGYTSSGGYLVSGRLPFSSDVDAASWGMLAGTNSRNGGPVMPTMDCYAWRIDRGQTTAHLRSTSNAVFLVVDGEGESTIGDRTMEWRQHDVFTVPYWNWASHRANSANAHLFQFTDREVLRNLDLLRDEGA